MRKKLAVLTMCAALAAGSLYGCAPEDGTSASTAAPANIEAQAESEKEETTAAASNTEVNEELKGDLVFAIWDNNLMDYIDPVSYTHLGGSPRLCRAERIRDRTR